MTNESVQVQKPMPKPSSDIDLQAMTTMPHISSEYMSDRLRNKFREFEYVYQRDEDGRIKTNTHGQRLVELDEYGNKKVRVVEDTWAVMEIFTQDLRLGNLGKDDLFAVRYHIDLCSDILVTMPERMSKAAFIALERAVVVSETSQSKGGFLRTLFNTFFSKSTTVEEKPKKSSFLGLGRKRGGE